MVKTTGVRPNAEPTVLYIAGSGRSGSTLVERALGAIPGFANVGELIDLCRRVAPAGELCGCGRPFGRCPFWAAVGERAFGGWDAELLNEMHILQRHVARQRHLPRLCAPKRPYAFERRLERYAEHYGRLYMAVSQEANAQYVVDASKWPAQAIALARGGVDVRVVHLARDPRGVAHSLAKRDVVRPHTVDEPDMMSGSRPAESAIRWGVTQSEVRLIRRLGVPVTRMQYEDFVRAPGAEVARALAELGVSVRPDHLAHLGDGVVTLGGSHGLSGNPSRFEQGVIRLRADQQWRTQMNRRDRILVSALTGPHLLRSVAARRVTDVDSLRTAPVANTSPDVWPTVAVLIPTRGRPQLVRESVMAVVAQSYPGIIQCFVIHDQEPPNKALETLAQDGRSVSCVSNAHAPGLAGARNTGLDIATADFIATCDDDDTWHPEKLELQILQLLNRPDLLVVGSGIRLLLPKGKVAEWPGRSDLIDRTLLLRNRVKELHSSTLVMRRDAFAKAGHYDENLPGGYAEDYDWVLRASRVGRIGVVRRPLADIRKDVQSYYTGHTENAIAALEHFLIKHPEISASRRGHARMLGQLAFNRSCLGRRREAIQNVMQALVLWPFSPYPYIALVQLSTGLDQATMRRLVRCLGRGMA